jgi:hypothetical protein
MSFISKTIAVSKILLGHTFELFLVIQVDVHPTIYILSK